MKIEPQTAPEMQKLSALIEDISTVMLTSIDAQHRLVSRPMSVLKMDSSGAFWFFADADSTTIHELAQVNLGFSDEEAATYVSIAGQGEVVYDRELVHALWSPLMKPWFPEGEESPNLALVKIRPHTVEYWNASQSKVVRIFAMVASVMGSKPIGMGENGSFTVPENA